MFRVLLVDDEPSIRWTMAEFLKRAGYEVVAAADYEGAVRALEGASVDVAVVDIFLPGRSGVELLQRLRASEPYVPTIMITGEPSLSQVPEIVRAGAYDYIAKPVVKDVLLNTVSRAVEKKCLIAEKQKLEQEIKRHAEELEERVAQRTAELAEAHNFLDAVLNSSTEYAIIAMDKVGRVTLFNSGAERMFERKAEDALGRPLGDLSIAPGMSGRSFLISVQEAGKRGHYQAEALLQRAGGGRFEGSVAVTPIRDRDGQLIGYLSIIKDLTVVRQSEEAIRQMQARLARNEKIASLGRVAAQVAHEVKNPLAGLRLYSMHLRSKVAGKLAEGELTLIDKIISTIDHLSHTAEQILNFARPVSLAPAAVDLNHIVKDVLQLLQPQITGNQVRVELDLCPEGARGLLDESAMRSVLLNLTLNAVQAMTDGGMLLMRTGGDDWGLRLEIADTGHGMSADQVKDIFEPFYTTRSKGLGLGMPYAQKVIEQHGGTIRVESREGEGTRVYIELPKGGDG